MFRPDTDEELNPMPMDPMTKVASPIDLRSYLTDLYKKKNLGDDKRMELEKSVAESKPGAGLTFLASLGAGLAGQNQAQAVDRLYQGSRDRQKELEDFDKKRTGVYDELKQDREIGKFERDQKDDLESSDPMSEKSKLMQSVAARLMPGQDFSKYSAKQLGNVMERLETTSKQAMEDARRKEDVALRQSELGLKRQDLQAQRELKKEEKEVAKAEKQKLLEDALSTPYGLAQTKEDAKNLKDAYVAKQSFDQKLGDMIALRKKHGGGAILNRDDVDVGKQLSKDLLLEYKNLAKLGVLSSSDRDIIDAIIPPDPLAYDFIPGQDPILAKMEKFKADKQKDFETNVATRVSAENRKNPAPPPASFPMTLRKDGKIATVKDENELKEAQSEGWK